MKMDREIIVLCAGGHARVVIDILRRSGQTVTALTDNNSTLHGTRLDDVPVIGADVTVFERDPKSVVLVNAMGNAPKIGDSALRRRHDLFDLFTNKGYEFLRVNSPDAVVSERAVLGAGSHIIAGAIINPGCTIGVNSIINTGAQLDHDCRVGDHTHIAPGSVLSGAVDVGHECHVGAGAVVVQGISIGDGAVVGAGAVVVKNVPAGATVFGSPAKPPAT
jgi:sugar O-acyltransferase (sialic acid O-acetyltransferase NeuD family)